MHKRTIKDKNVTTLVVTEQHFPTLLCRGWRNETTLRDAILSTMRILPGRSDCSFEGKARRKGIAVPRQRGRQFKTADRPGTTDLSLRYVWGRRRSGQVSCRCSNRSAA